MILGKLETFVTLSEEEIISGSIHINIHNGLCNNLLLHYLDNDVFTSWEHCDPIGKYIYPIPCGVTDDYIEQYITNLKVGSPKVTSAIIEHYKQYRSEFAFDYLPKYEGKQLELRKSLAHHTIKVIKEVLGERGITNE